MSKFFILVSGGKVCGISYAQLQRGEPGKYSGYIIEAETADAAKATALQMWAEGKPSQPEAFRKF